MQIFTSSTSQLVFEESTQQIQRCLWTLELLSEALIENDDLQGSDPAPQLTLRNITGIHGAIRIISRVASGECSKLRGDDIL
ncbi:MAG: hypothetical protein ACRERW_14775 [Pseudomonas sp.]